MRTGGATARRGRSPSLTAVALGSSGASAGAVTVRAPRSTKLHVAISVPSVLSSNGHQVWVANTGTSSVLELSAKTGKELLDVSGMKYHLDNPDAIVQYGNDVWVADAASNAVTEFSSKSGALKHVLADPKLRFAVPGAIAIADHHVFVLSADHQQGDRGEREDGQAHPVPARPPLPPPPRGRHGARRQRRVDREQRRRGGTLTELSAATGGVVRVVTASAGHLDSPTAIATDGRYLWVANAQGAHLSELSASSGALVRTVTSTRLKLNRVTSITVAGGRVWLASTAAPALVAGLAQNGDVVPLFAHRFGFPAVFGDSRHVWVVDRIQSRVSELSDTLGQGPFASSSTEPASPPLPHGDWSPDSPATMGWIWSRRHVVVWMASGGRRTPARDTHEQLAVTGTCVPSPERLRRPRGSPRRRRLARA